jgi:hypothetical protein
MTRSELPALEAQISIERQRLAEVVREIDSLRRSLENRAPTRIELMATAGYLHNLYNAFENCMLRLPAGSTNRCPPVPTGTACSSISSVRPSPAYARLCSGVTWRCASTSTVVFAAPSDTCTSSISIGRGSIRSSQERPRFSTTSRPTSTRCSRA